MRSLALALLVSILSVSPGVANAALTDTDLPGWPLSHTIARGAVGGDTLWLLLTAPTDGDPPWINEARGRGLLVGISSSGKASVRTTSGTQSEERWRPVAESALYRLDAASGELRCVAENLPAEVRGIDAADLDGDGDDEILLGSPGRLAWTDETGVVRLLLELPTVDPDPWMFRSVRLAHPDGLGRLWVETVGALVGYAPNDEGEPWREVARAEMPVGAGLSGAHLVIWSPGVLVPAGRAWREPFLLATRPEDYANQRLRTELYRVGPDGEPAIEEHWSRYLGRERIADVRLLRFDGDVHLAVWTERADRLQFFPKARLSLFALSGDRTRAGKPPVLFLEDAGGDGWNRPEIHVLDANRDGRDDLLLIHPTRKRLRVETYLRRPDGRFREDPAETSLKLDDAGDKFETAFIARDLGGDGRAALIALTEDSALVFSGRDRARRGRRLFHRDPHKRVQIPAPEDPQPGDSDAARASQRLWSRWLVSEDGDLSVALVEWHEARGAMVLRVVDLE